MQTKLQSILSRQDLEWNWMTKEHGDNVTFEGIARVHNWQFDDETIIDRLAKEWSSTLPDIIHDLIGHGFKEALAKVEQQVQEVFGMSTQDLLKLEAYYHTNPNDEQYGHDMVDNMSHWFEQSLGLFMTGKYHDIGHDPDWRNCFDEEWIKEVQDEIWLINNV